MQKLPWTGNVREFRNVIDWFTEFPADSVFEGDNYLVGRTVPNGDGKPEAEFIGYLKQRKLLCINGFDESREDLWAPAWTSPRWCVGRPLGRKKFDDLDDFLKTIKSLESVGINKASDLKPIALDETKTCN